MPVNSLIFTYNNTSYNFNAKALSESLFKIQFLDYVNKYSLPQHFFLNVNHVIVFLSEEPNAPYATTTDAHNFLSAFSTDLKAYMLEFVQ